MFSKRLKQFITCIDKKPAEIAKELSCTDMFIRRHSSQEKEPDIIVFLRKFIIAYNLTPEDLYCLVVGDSPDHANNYYKIITELENKLSMSQVVIKDLSATLNFISQQFDNKCISCEWRKEVNTQ